MFTVRSRPRSDTRSGWVGRRPLTVGTVLTAVTVLTVGLLGAGAAGATPPESAPPSASIIAATSATAPDPAGSEAAPTPSTSADSAAAPSPSSAVAAPATTPSQAPPSTAVEPGSPSTVELPPTINPVPVPGADDRAPLRTDDAVPGDAPTTGTPQATVAADPTDAVTAVAAARILDTRTGLGARGPVGPGRSISVPVVGLGGVPATGVTAVVLTVTVPGPTTAGTVTAWASGTSAPTVPALRFAPGTGVTTQIWVPVGSDGKIVLRNDSTAAIAVLADSVGYAGTGTGAGSYAPVAPARLLDSAIGLGMPRGTVAAGGSVDVTVAGRAGVPQGAAAAVVAVTVVDPSADGWLTARPSGLPPVVSPSSQLNWSAGTTTSGQLLVPLSGSGAITVYNRGAGAVSLQVDVLGYVRGGTAASGSLVALPATRIVDSRNGLRWPIPRGPLNPRSGLTLKVAGLGGIPTSGVSAVLLQVVAITPRGAGNLLVTQDFVSGPAGIAVKFGAGQTRSSSVLVPVNSNGTVVLTNPTGSGAVDVAVDALGYIAAPTAEPAMQWSAARPTDAGLVNGISALDCAGSSFCLALDTQGHSATFDGTRWTAVGGPALPPFPGSVSCGSPTSCLATFGTNGVRKFTGDGWTALTSPSSEFLSAAGCWAADGCIVVAGVTGEAWRWTGSAFTAIPALFTGSDPTDPSAPYAGSLSCTSASFCAAVGTGSPSSWLWNGSSWTTGELVPYASSTDVDCVSSDFCVAASADIGSVVTFRGGGYQQSDVNWSSTIKSVSCPDTTFCVGVTDGSEIGLWDGTTWSNPAFPPTVSGSPAFVSCPTRQLCVALQRDGQQVIGRR